VKRFGASKGFCMGSENATWLKVLGIEELPEGRVKPVTCQHRTLCLTHFDGQYAALDNKCPHQGGPLGEGSIEGGWLRCPWHGWDFHPLTGKPPGGFDDGVATFPVEMRDDGIYVALPEEEPRARTSSDVMVETLINWGIRWVWGMVGHSNLGFAEAMRRQEIEGSLGYFGIRHEGAASFAASAYGKLTGRPAACFAIAGPGATNLLTGLWDAHVDRAPVIALTGQVPTHLIGRGAFQEVDLAAAFGGVAKYTAAAAKASDFAEITSLACKHAILEQGVSHMVLPDDVQVVEAPETKAGSPQGRIAARGIAPPEDALDQAAERIAAAKRPVIIVGHGARFVMAPVVALAERLNAPIMTTFKGKGLIADDHPLGCGVLGRSGTPVASWFMNEADLLIVLGASFSNHTGITSYKPIVQVDYDPMTLGRFHSVTVPVWGEIGVTARLLHARLRSVHAIDQRPDVRERWKIWRDEKRRRLRETGTHGVHSAAIFAALTATAPDDAIIAVDVGNNTYSFGRYFECKRQSVLMSGYLGSIGFGYPAAMGAWAATQEGDPRFSGRKVIAVTGDGGFGQYMAEYTTAVKYQMNITHILLNNGELGKISKEQRSADYDVWQTSLHNPSFAQYAKLCGAMGLRVTAADELEGAFAEALAHDGPATVEILADSALI
jgi:thiamine pyrophosphate-dependent acetolactate synthase large subunit-like protein/nitrite reductase/ring-hydroxylating ferredoxin subunit